MAKTICKILGVGFLLIGLLGFVQPNLLGMHLSPTHNVIHLLSAGTAFYFGFAAALSAARGFCLAFGAVYLLLGVLGFVSPGTISALVQAHNAASPNGNLLPDNLVHLVLGGLFLLGGLLRTSESVVDNRRDYAMRH